MATDDRFVRLWAALAAAMEKDFEAAWSTHGGVPLLGECDSPATGAARAALYAHADAAGLCRCCGDAAHDPGLFCEPPRAAGGG